MNTNINLILPKDEGSIKQRKQTKNAYLIAFGTLFLVGLISLGLFIGIQATNLSSIKDQQQNVLSQISDLKEKRAKLLVVNDRIGNIQEILATRKDLLKISNAILAKAPGDLSIKDFSADGKTILLTVQSPSLLSIGEFINGLTEMAKSKDMFSSLVLSDLTFDQSKNYYEVSVKTEK